MDHLIPPCKTYHKHCPHWWWCLSKPSLLLGQVSIRGWIVSDWANCASGCVVSDCPTNILLHELWFLWLEIDISIVQYSDTLMALLWCIFASCCTVFWHGDVLFGIVMCCCCWCCCAYGHRDVSSSSFISPHLSLSLVCVRSCQKIGMTDRCRRQTTIVQHWEVRNSSCLTALFCCCMRHHQCRCWQQVDVSSSFVFCRRT
jgi:hypothetical protein